MRLIDADRLLSEKMKSTYYHLPNGDIAIPLIDIEHAPTIEPEQRWIPCSERLPDEDHWLGGSGRQFSDEVLVSVANYDDEATWTYISQTIDGNWALELPRHCEIVAWMPLPEPYQPERRQ